MISISLYFCFLPGHFFLFLLSLYKRVFGSLKLFQRLLLTVQSLSDFTLIEHVSSRIYTVFKSFYSVCFVKLVSVLIFNFVVRSVRLLHWLQRLAGLLLCATIKCSHAPRLSP